LYKYYTKKGGISLRGKRAFTIIESLVSLFLIIVTAITLLSVFSTSKKGLQLSDNHVNAASLGYSLLENARKNAFDNITPVSGKYEYKGLNDNSQFSQNFSYDVKVETPETDQKRVWATVTWEEATGSKRITVETIIVRVQ
jgi:type II secretory pathway pseudopilin PulG